MKPVDLHIPSWYRWQMTRLVVKTIHRNTKRENFRIVVLDHGSNQETRDALQGLYDDGYIDELTILTDNIGLGPARSKILFEMTHSPYFICVDNDCLPPPMDKGRDWIERLVDLMDKHEEYGAIAARTQVMIGTGNIFADTDDIGADITEFPWPGGSLRIMRTKETRNVGGWRETPGRGSEERDICGKLQVAGFKTGFANNIRTHHLFGIRGEGSDGTDRWGYNKKWSPQKSGHNNVYHPALEQGDQFEDVKAYAGEELAKEYFDD